MQEALGKLFGGVGRIAFEQLPHNPFPVPLPAVLE
jgi:hypothetical protein